MSDSPSAYPGVGADPLGILANRPPSGAERGRHFRGLLPSIVREMLRPKRVQRVDFAVTRAFAHRLIRREPGSDPRTRAHYEKALAAYPLTETGPEGEPVDKSAELIPWPLELKPPPGG